MISLLIHLMKYQSIDQSHAFKTLQFNNHICGIRDELNPFQRGLKNCLLCQTGFVVWGRIWNEAVGRGSGHMGIHKTCLLDLF